MIIVNVPPTYTSERRYILDVILNEFLGIDYKIVDSDQNIVSIFSRLNKKKIVLPDTLFSYSKSDWLTEKTLPSQPLNIWDSSELDLEINLVSKKIPAIYGEEKKSVIDSEQISLPIDIFGSTFFMLTRYEEIVKKDRDNHDRFPATASLAFQEGFLERPIVNEYVEVLWSAMHFLWPELQRKSRKFQLRLSHDVDVPFLYGFMPIHKLVRRMGADLLKRKSISLAIKSLYMWMRVKFGKWEDDPYNTFNMIMDLSNKMGVKSAFYFITDHSAGKIDGNYYVEHSQIRKIIGNIAQRGHEIGLHTSYNTYRSSEQTKKEFDRLKKVCKEEGVEQEEWGGRQHFLRCEVPTTFQNWEDAGLQYDTTLGFADRVGFRSGCCYEYPVYNLKSRMVLSLIERPLVVMECTVIDKKYMNLGSGAEAQKKMKTLKEIVKQFNGDFSLLWHNSRFVEESEVGCYTNIINN